MVFLDFDGVLFDTVKEAYVVALITTCRYGVIDEINFNTEHYHKFKKLRYLVSPAWNYKYLLEELALRQDLFIIEKNFKKKIINVKKEDYKDFENNFFNTRDYLKKEHYTKWLKLNMAFTFIKKIKFIFDDYQEQIYIITTKDKATVIKLLSSENIKFNSNRIFDKDSYEKLISKKSIIEDLINKNDTNIFIDDSDRHIKSCLQIEGLKCFQPSWGYVSPNSKTVDQEIIIDEISRIIKEN